MLLLQSCQIQLDTYLGGKLPLGGKVAKKDKHAYILW
jgi:hypothetical protein